MIAKRHVVKFKIFFLSGFSYILGFILRFFIPRDKSYWTVIGREHGKFLDNAKYFTIFASQEEELNKKICFLTEYPEVANSLRELGINSVVYPKIGSIWRLMRTGTLIVDSMDYMEHGRIGLISGCKIIQLWHGIPLKQIELSLYKERLDKIRGWKKTALSFHTKFVGRYKRVDILVSTSPYVENMAFSKCFSYREVLNSGYPRNEILKCDNFLKKEFVFLNVDLGVMNAISLHKKNGGKVIIYMPTFRKDRQSPLGEKRFDLLVISEFCKKNNILLILKLHPLMSVFDCDVSLDNVISISPDSDSYPLIKEVDILITDYSSVYFDFLLLDKPIIFFPYDLDDYTKNDRPLFFDYCEVTPGEKVFNSDALVEAIYNVVYGSDDWSDARNLIREKFFLRKSESSFEEILKHMNAK